MRVTEVVDPRERSSLCESILRGLPEWFGIESAVEREEIHGLWETNPCLILVKRLDNAYEHRGR